MRDGDGSVERPSLPGQLLSAVPARGGVEPVGAAASRDRRPAASARGRRPRGVVGGARTEALSERASSPGPLGRGSAGDVAFALDQGGGVRGGELPPHSGAPERQLAEPALLRAGSSARLSASGRGAPLDRMKPLTTRKTNGG